VRFGPKCEKGFLPVYSVGSEEEAKTLLSMCCGTNLDREYVARELLHDQSIENLEAFGDRLHKFHKILIDKKRCDCRRD
jgi:hypothetical protein